MHGVWGGECDKCRGGECGVWGWLSECSCSNINSVNMYVNCPRQVTMEWWTHLWLNEGFATWIEYLCVDHTHPEFEIWTNFLSREYASALNLDALDNSHPIEVSHLLGLCL